MQSLPWALGARSGAQLHQGVQEAEWEGSGETEQQEEQGEGPYFPAEGGFPGAGSLHQGGTATLATGGTPLTATLGKIKLKPGPKFSNDSLNRLQLKMGASDNNIKTLGNFLRVNCGRESVNKHEAFMKERNTKLEEFFETKKVILIEGGG